MSDAQFARRVYLDAWGLLPAPDELRRSSPTASPDKRAALVDRLLADNDKYAEHWISFWNDLLRNEDGVSYFSETAGRKSITDWLLPALAANLPYDRFVTALLNPTAPADPEGFLIGVNWRGETSAAVTPWMQAAQNTAQVFLGINLKCNACHDSFVSRWKLKDAYALAAYLLAGAVAAAVPLRRRAEQVRGAGVPVSGTGSRAAHVVRSPIAARPRRRSSPIRATAACRGRWSTGSGTGSSAAGSSPTPTRWTAVRGARSCSISSPRDFVVERLRRQAPDRRRS